MTAKMQELSCWIAIIEEDLGKFGIFWSAILPGSYKEIVNPKTYFSDTKTI